MTKVQFSALQCDTRVNAYMKACDLMDGVGEEVIISYVTENEVTPEYLSKMAKHIESMPPINNICFRCVKPI
jgi:hypothetical protein